MIKNDNVFSIYSSNLEKWTFNEHVSKIFSDMTKRSIPCYSNIIFIIGILANRFVRTDTNIYDLGCSLGSATLELCRTIKVLNCRIIAIDNSPSMIVRCRRRINALHSNVQVEVVEGDICTFPIENSSLVLLNFTLQFIKPEQRLPLLKRIHKGLNVGGALILSEKFRFTNQNIDNLLSSLYHDFKRTNGYSESEIRQKYNMLKNVMYTDTIESHKIRLAKAGFDYFVIWFQCLNFCSFLAIKSEIKS